MTDKHTEESTVITNTLNNDKMSRARVRELSDLKDPPAFNKIRTCASGLFLR